MGKTKFEEIEVGQELPSIELEITQEDINRYAVASLDFNPVHTDPDWMKATKKFGEEFFTGIWDIEENVAHGNATISTMISLITNWIAEDGGFLASLDSTLTKPVLNGDTIKCTGKITEKHPVEDKRAAYEGFAEEAESFNEICGNSFVVVKIDAKNQNDETIGFAKAKVIPPE